jgi:hypothetical protein
MQPIWKSAALLLLVTALAEVPAADAQENGWTWSDAAELSFVFTGGNSSVNTLGLKNTLTGTGGNHDY